MSKPPRNTIEWRGRGPWIVVATILFVAPSVMAQGQYELPSGRLGLVFGGRQNLGRVADDYGQGYLIGAEAGYQFGPERPWSVGATWGVALFGLYNKANRQIIEEWIRIAQMNFGLRFQVLVTRATPRFVVVTAGATLLRTEFPIPPDDQQRYAGPYAGVAIEQFFARSKGFGAELQYQMFGLGPGSITLWVRVFGGK